MAKSKKIIDTTPVAWSKEDAAMLQALVGDKVSKARVMALATTLDTSPGAVRNLLAAAHAYKRDGVTPTAHPTQGLRIHSSLADKTRTLIANAGKSESKPVKRSHKKAAAEPVAEPIAEVPSEPETGLEGHVLGTGLEGTC